MYFNQEWERLHAFETDYVKLYYYDFEPGYTDTYHSYEYHRICTILSGEKNVKVGKSQEFTYNKDGYVLLSPHSEVSMSMPEETKALVLELSDHLLDDVTGKVQNTFDHKIQIDNYDYFHGQMSNLINTSLHSINHIYGHTQDKDDKNFLIDLAVQKLTFGLLKQSETRYFINHENNHPMKEALDLIKDNYDKGISVSEIAYTLHMSKSNFTNQFKKYFGVTPKTYINTVKLKKSKEMLEGTTVSEVAYTLGYSNVSSFIEAFKKQFGTTPKKYQLTH